MPVKVKKVIQYERDVPDLAQRIKQARQSSDKSLTTLAKLAGISRKYWYQVENDAVDGSLAFETLCKIELALGVNFGVFEGESDRPC